MNKALIFIIVTLTILLLFGYFYFFSNNSSSFNVFGNNESLKARGQLDLTKNPGSSAEEKFSFYIENSSDNYSELNYRLKNIFALTKENSSNSPIVQTEISTFLKETISFYQDENNDKKERAYALNMFTLVFLQGMNSDLFIDAIKLDNKIFAEYNKNVLEISSLKSNKNNVSGVMFNNGNIKTNIAVQKTHAYINSLSYDLYPNAYAILRQSLNINQSNLLIYLNFELDKKYTPEEFVGKSKYYNNYLSFFEPKIEKFIQDGSIYNDLYQSSYEPDIMYSEFLFIKYLLNKNSNKKVAVETLNKINLLTESLIVNSDKYNSNKNLYYGYVTAAVNKVRIVNTKELESSQTEELLNRAELIFLDLIRNTQNKQMDYWVAGLSPQISTYKSLEVLGQRNSEINKYLSDVRKN